MFTGGMTQFLAKAQGMPHQIENELVRIICFFIWDESTAPPMIAIKKLYAPKEQGDINLLNLPAWNKAIDLTWLRAYLDLSPSRPNWAFVTSVVIDRSQTRLTCGVNKISQSIVDWSELLTRSQQTN